MKKQHILWAAVAVVILITGIFPSVAYRARNDRDHRYYMAAVDLSGFAEVLPITKTRPLLKDFKAAGVQSVVIRERPEGYLSKFLKSAEDAGLEIVLQPDVRDKSIHNLEKVIEQYGVRAIKLQVNSWSKKEESAEKRAEICRLIRERKMILILTETMEQLSNYHPEGFEEYMEAAEGRILRSYCNPNYTSAERRDYPYTYYHHLSAALDRNIRFLLAAPLKDKEFTAEENAERMVESMARLCEKLEEEGFRAEPDPDLSVYPPRRTLPSAAVAALVVLMAAVVLDLWRKKGEKWLYWGAPLVSLAAFGATFLMPERLLLLYPTGFAAVEPCFCFAVVYEFLKSRRARASLWRLLLSGCLLAAALLLLCGGCLAAMINGADYWLNELSFRGVKLALMVPIAFAMIWMLHEAYNEWKPISLREIWQAIRGGFRWYHGLLFLAAVALAGLYLMRSGHVNSIPFWETQMRDGLTEWLLARPRTKEFLAGWPCLILLIFEMHRGKKSNLFRWIFGVVAAVLFASVTNTFCHVFTPVEAMAMRTVYGLILGCLIGGIILLLLLLLFKLIRKK